MTFEKLPIYKLVIEDIKVRAEIGKKEYGDYLKVETKVCPFQYAYDEILDLAVYWKFLMMKQEWERRKQANFDLEKQEIIEEIKFFKKEIAFKIKKSFEQELADDKENWVDSQSSTCEVDKAKKAIKEEVNSWNEYNSPSIEELMEAIDNAPGFIPPSEEEMKLKAAMAKLINLELKSWD